MLLLTGLSACVPAYYPGYPPYYARPAYQSAPPARPRPEEPQRGSAWVNPEPVR